MMLSTTRRSGSCSPNRRPPTAIVLAAVCLVTLYCSSNGSNNQIFNKKSSKKRAVAAQERLEYTRRAIEDISWRPDDVLLVAHRGCIGRFPENSLAAIAACSEEGAHLAEIDLELTRDGHLVLMHDRSPDRTTNRAHWKHTTPVVNLSLADLKSKYWLVQNEYTGVLTNFRIPTFKEAVAVARACGVHLYVDSKGRKHLEQPLVDALKEADAFDIVLLDQFQNTTVAEEASSGRFVVNVNSSTPSGKQQQSSATVWKPYGPLRKESQGLCKLCQQDGKGCMFSSLWQSGEYYLRDPDTPSKKLAQLLAGQPQSTHSPCPESDEMEEPCLGAHLYQPLAKATCARMLVTDLPGTARSALLASEQMAPTSVYPLEPVRSTAEDGTFHRQPRIPACLKQYLSSQ